MLGQIASYSLFLSWGSRCWNRFAIYSFAKQWVPAGTRANHAAVGRIASCQHGGGGGGEWLGTSRDISEYFVWIVGSWRGAFKSIFFLEDENGFEKLGRNGFLSHSLTYLV